MIPMKFPITPLSEKPSSTPMIPPMNPVRIASAMNISITSLLFEPIAFMTPISRVRSITLIVIVLMMPTPATTRLMAAMPPSTAYGARCRAPSSN